MRSASRKGKKTYPAFVDCVDEGDEASGEIALCVVHTGDLGHDECIVVSDELEVVGGTGRAADELLEGEVSGFAAGAGHFDFTTPDNLGICVGRVFHRFAQEVEPLLCVACCVFAERVVINGCWGTRDFTVIRWGVEVDDGQVVLKEVDAWNK